MAISDRKTRLQILKTELAGHLHSAAMLRYELDVCR